MPAEQIPGKPETQVAVVPGVQRHPLSIKPSQSLSRPSPQTSRMGEEVARQGDQERPSDEQVWEPLAQIPNRPVSQERVVPGVQVQTSSSAIPSQSSSTPLQVSASGT